MIMLKDAADEIERLRAKKDDTSEKMWVTYDASWDIVEILRDLEKSKVIPVVMGKAANEIERLRKVLAPFAEAADTLDKEQWDHGSIEGSCAYITAKDCRDARDALDEILK